jgi:nucleoside-diphosphate-sugar epimerase
MRAFVTGATGFLGRRVVEALTTEGWSVRACGRTASALVDLAGRFEGGRALETVCLRLDRDPLEGRLFEGCDVLFHLAGAMKGAPSALCLHNVVATRRLLAAARATAIGRVVVVTSLAVYACAALQAGDELDESCPLETRPASRGAYVFSKLAQEEACTEARRGGLHVVVVRPGVIYGPGRNPISDRVGLRVGATLLVFGGTHPLPYTYVENCAQAVVSAGSVAGLHETAFNVVDDELPRGRELAERCAADAGLCAWRLPQAAIVPFAHGYEFCRRHSRGQLPLLLPPDVARGLYQPLRFSNRRAKRALGWRPRIGLEEGLSRTVAAFDP